MLVDHSNKIKDREDLCFNVGSGQGWVCGFVTCPKSPYLVMLAVNKSQEFENTRNAQVVVGVSIKIRKAAGLVGQ